jgi:DNA end-binding protein Ku
MADMAAVASRPVWTGSISFGLVTIPVRLFTAIREKRLSFRSLHDQDQVPLKQKMVCPADGKEVHPEHVVKGFEIEKDRFVVVRQDELEAATPKATKAIEIQDFVNFDEIDPVYFDRPYYVVPKPEGIKPYQLLVKAMEKAGRVGIARVVMHTKEYLAALRPIDGALCLETMHFSDEVLTAKSVTPSDAKVDPKAKVDDRALKMAQQLIDSLTTRFDPGKYHDEYREKIMQLIEQKAAGEEIVTRPESDEKTPRKGSDLMAALEASLAKNKTSKAPSASHSHAGHAHTRKRKSA